MVNLWVIDELTGAKDYCSTFIIVQDNNNEDICDPNANKVTVEGNVFTETSSTVEGVQVDLGVPLLIDTTDVVGEYAFGNMPMGGQYLVTPFKDDDYLNGVTTLDLVIIQRHILALQRLDSPYKLIAADIDRSKHITARDLIELRKLILGIYEDFPENTSWRFVDADYQFIDNTNPWIEEFPEDYNIDELEEDMIIDFIGVKIGDVNDDVKAHSYNGDEEEYRLNTLRFTIEEDLEDGGEYNIAISSSNYQAISGWQGTIEFDPELIEIISLESTNLNMTDRNSYLGKQDQGWVTFSYDDRQATEVDKNEEIFRIKVRAKQNCNSSDLFELSSKVTPLQAYRGYDEIIDLRLDNTVDETARILSINPNPWIQRSELEFEIAKKGRVDFEFYDVNGALITRHSADYDAGINTLNLERSQFNLRGLIYVKMMTQKTISEHKMIILE